MQPETPRNIVSSAIKAVDFYDRDVPATKTLHLVQHLDLNASLLRYVSALSECSVETSIERTRHASYAVYSADQPVNFIPPVAPLVLALDYFERAPDALGADPIKLIRASCELNNTLIQVVSLLLNTNRTRSIDAIRRDLRRTLGIE